MKQRLTVMLAVLTLCITSAMAFNNEKKGHMPPDEFRQIYQNYICEQAKLTKEEAAAFFPIYNECQEKKENLNKQIWKLRKEARGKELTEQEYQRILEEISTLCIQIDEINKAYLPIYHKVLSYKKIFEVQGAESRFHREMLKKMNHPQPKREENKRKM